MNGQKKVILHLVFDGILFDRVYPRFEQMEHYENIYLFGSLNKDYDIKYIKNTEKILRFDSLDDWRKVVENPQVDIIYMHGLWGDYLKAIDYIQNNVVVMWWCYGMEIYENCFGQVPLLPLKIYKPLTFRFVQSQLELRSQLTNGFMYYSPYLFDALKSVYGFILGRRNLLKQMLSRVDFVFTPLEVEYCELIKRHPYIKAKPFKLRAPFVQEPLEIHTNTGGILLEHSANLSNNHLDIIATIKKKKLNLHNNIYIPLSYGDERLAELVKEKAIFEGAQTHCLTKALPLNEYKEMMSGCSHAIFGMIRQSGLGNIFLCFIKGIKVFFFKDSILYQQFKADGYDVFSIEDDLNEKSIREPLSSDQALNNYNRYYSRFDASIGSYDEQFEKILKEI